MAKVTVTVSTENGIKTIVKHVSGGTDRQVVEVIDGSYSFDVREFEGDNLFIVGTPTPSVPEQSHLEVQEEAKINASKKTEDNSEKEVSDAKTSSSSGKSEASKDADTSKVDDKSKNASSAKTDADTSAKK